MKHDPQNIFFHELIGLEVEVVRHPDPSLVGLHGTIVWEGSRTLKVRSNGRTITMLKSGGLFRFTLPSGDKVLVEGDLIIGDPAARARRARRMRR
ncbi:MAG: ribonuclease P protein subunit [Desulfurococcales archaeon]|nr:ribonuclease P protein subunit [Desulfurococcales archaeon]